MKIQLVTPAARGSRSGNRITATRWSTILSRLGHQVRIVTEDDGQAADIMVAIHAWRSAGAAAAFKNRQPQAPLVVLLAGTDIYRFQHSHPTQTLRSMHLADRLVGLHDRVRFDIPAKWAVKLRIIYQSYPPFTYTRTPYQRVFQVCVVGHLRDEKDPLRAAYAARLVPDKSRLRVVHIGAAHTPQWAALARHEESENPRYTWRGQVPAGQVRRYYARSNAMVVSSIMEGGANVVSEAIVSGLPILASDISGNRGLLGDVHAGYFPAEDERALAELLVRSERDPAFLQGLATTASQSVARFTPEAELASWETLLEELS